MDVAPKSEVLLHLRVVCHVRQYAQFNLRIVGVHKHISLFCDEEPAEFTPKRRAHRDVLQIRLSRGNTPRARFGLVEARVNAPVRRDGFQQALAVRGTQLRQRAVAQNLINCRMYAAQTLQHICVCGVSLFRLFAVRQSELYEQRFAQLHRGVDVEFVPHVFINFFLKRVHLLRKHLAVGFYGLAVNKEAAFLHLAQNQSKRNFNVLQ